MRVKEIERTANIAWSPASQYPIYIVAGTAAQQLDATFSTSSALEIYSLSLAEATLEMPLISSAPSQCRFHKVLWGSFGSDTEQSGLSSGVIVAGADDGHILVYSAEKMIAGKSDSDLEQLTKHAGAVKSLDFNPFQVNLLASGASESEIYIWDLNKPDNPMTPGQKSQPPEEVSSVAWNRQVQHILASSFAARCVVWDLRKNEPIIKISDSMARLKANLVAWHPEVATQLCLASEDDHTPVIQLWDLRYATSPLKVLENHKRGVLSVAWCQRDPDLLLSCGKDNRILCWNPNSNVQGGEVVYELPTNNQWSFDVQWCPRNPALISSATFDGHITIYSLMGGGHPIQPSNKVAESFNTVDPISQAPIQVPHVEEEKVMSLQKPPKWIRKPVGASFAFGGKLVTFERPAPSTTQQQTASPRIVRISQVTTETELVSRSNQLQQALATGQYAEFCALKAANSTDSMQESIWNFLRVNFENEPRARFLQLLGYDQTELARKVTEHTGATFSQPASPGVDAKELAHKMSQLNAGDGRHITGLQAGSHASPNVGSKTPDSRDELSDGSAAFDEISANQSGLQTPLVIPNNGDDASSLLAQALLMGNFEAAVEMCLSENKMAEAILLSIAGGPELLLRTQRKYFQHNKSNLGRLISSVVTHDWAHIVQTCELDNWKDALAIILTYALPEEFSELCDTLAKRLETEQGGDLSLYASLCYICSGNLDKLVENWARNTDNNNSSIALQDLVEKVMVLKRAVESSRGLVGDGGNALAERLSQYAGLLASQGSLATARAYLGNNNSTDMRLAVLQDRLFRALGQQATAGTAAPAFPFQRVNIVGPGVSPQVKQAQQASLTSYQPHQVSSLNPSNFQVSSTAPVTNYYNQPQQQLPVQPQPQSQFNGPSSNTTFSPQPAVAASVVSNKGPLSHKYPSYPQGSAMYGLDTYPQSGIIQSHQDYTQPYSQQAYYNPGYTQPASQPSNLYNPALPSAGGSYSAGGNSPHVPAHSQVFSYQDKKADSAWNDPPPIRESKKSKPVASYEQSGPITAPIFGVPQSQPVPSEHPGAPTDYGGYPNLYNPQEHQPVVQRPPVPSYNPHVASLTPAQTQMQPPKPTPEPPAPIVKGPIPAEHLVLQSVLDSLHSLCSQRATNAQMKRKLEDVARKLELLYDKLRENSLSQSVLLGLHQLVQGIQACDYGSALNVHTGLISHGNFSEISAFMPALKVLMQTAAQLNVYVQ